MINVDYPDLLTLVKEFLDPKRSESASFLIWYLENYYRLDSQEAVDSVCDQSGDKGVDGVYINTANGTIDIFQSKISQKMGRTIGDTALKEFAGTLSQFASVQNLTTFLDSAGQAEVGKLIKRLNLIALLEQYKIRGIFISNIELDANGKAYLELNSQIEFIGKADLETSFISTSRDVIENASCKFNVDGLNIGKYYVDADTVAYIAPIKAKELVQMMGISDQSVFAYNVRGPLGNTNVNRDIVSSLKDIKLHKKFPLFHNGITIISNSVTETEKELTINTFYVVNGCQSLTALYNNRKYITEDLQILCKIVQVGVDSDLSMIITNYSNNQNGVKARDFKSNSNIQIRLQNEFKSLYGSEYFFEVKRGEHSDNLISISNETAGILIMSFDLKTPWATHRKYQVFDDQYSEIFGRPEITAHHILLLHILEQIIIGKLPNISNQLIAKYALTKYIILYILRKIFEQDNVGRKLIAAPENFVFAKKDRAHFVEAVTTIVDDIVIDFNGEVGSLGEDFDYRSRLREEVWVMKLTQEIVSSYQKQVNRKRIDSFEQEWNKVKTSK
jgi:hypothetical protein